MKDKKEEKQEKKAAPTTKAEKFKAIDQVGKALDKTYESKTFQMQGKKVGQKIPSIPTNLPTVDREVFGCGGFPRGRVVEIYGPESSGKTAICLHTIGQCQQAGGVAAFVDAEHALDPTFANTLGVNMDELVISQPDYGEQALEIVEALVDSQAVDLIVVDSVTALVPRAELEGDMGDSHMGLQARLMSQAMRKLIGKCAKKMVTVIFINQVREKVGLVFGNPEVTTGGRALKFFSSLRVEVRRVSGATGLHKEGDKVIGHRIKVKAQKNKVGAPFKETEISLYYDNGFDMVDDMIEYALSVGILEGSAWLNLKGSDEKFRREELGMNLLVPALDKYYQELASKIEGVEDED